MVPHHALVQWQLSLRHDSVPAVSKTRSFQSTGGKAPQRSRAIAHIMHGRVTIDKIPRSFAEICRFATL